MCVKWCGAVPEETRHCCICIETFGSSPHCPLISRGNKRKEVSCCMQSKSNLQSELTGDGVATRSFDSVSPKTALVKSLKRQAVLAGFPVM